MFPQFVKSVAHHLLKHNKPTITFANMSSINTYEHLKVTVPNEFVYQVELNRPTKMNAMNYPMWLEIGKCFEDLGEDENCRVIILSGAGKLFTAGIDLMQATDIFNTSVQNEDVARRGKILLKYLVSFQKSMTALELCRKPVLAAIHSGCIGGGVSLITAADTRYCTKDAWFQVKELEIGMAADVGALQRLPKIVGNDGWVREVCYTARKVEADEALAVGLVSRVYEDKDRADLRLELKQFQLKPQAGLKTPPVMIGVYYSSLLKNVMIIAREIAKKSPVAIQGIKHNIVYSRDHTVQEGLDHIAVWNQLMLQSEDCATATVASVTKSPDVHFAKL